MKSKTLKLKYPKNPGALLDNIVTKRMEDGL